MALGSANTTLISPLLADLRVSSTAPPRTVTLADTDALFESLPSHARARFVLSDGVLYRAESRCVYRRAETTAYALSQLLARHRVPDFDLVLNCRDGPLVPKLQELAPRRPLLFAYSTTAEHADLPFPDYTIWGLPGKIKPWAQLRHDLLERAQTPFSRKRARVFASGVINSHHASVGVRARQAVQTCASDPRFAINFHRLYFERFYSTEEHCEYKYILLAPGSHAVWLDHLKQKLLCGSLIFLIEPAEQPAQRFQYDMLTRLLVAGVHYVSVPLPPGITPGPRKRAAEEALCASLRNAVDKYEADPESAERIARAGRALVRDAMTMDAILDYMAHAVRAAASLLAYAPADAVRTERTIDVPRKGRSHRWPFRAANFTRVPSDPDAFARTLRRDDSYPVSARVSVADFEAVVLKHNYSAMGQSFRASAAELRAKVVDAARRGRGRGRAGGARTARGRSRKGR